VNILQIALEMDSAYQFSDLKTKMGRSDGKSEQTMGLPL
jgi:hypothetical protein